MDLIRQIQKDGGDWFFYDVNFHQAMQNDETLSSIAVPPLLNLWQVLRVCRIWSTWLHVDQILHTRDLNRSKNAVVSTSIKPFQIQAPRKTRHKFNWGGTAMECVATSMPAIIAGETIQIIFALRTTAPFFQKIKIKCQRPLMLIN